MKTYAIALLAALLASFSARAQTCSGWSPIGDPAPRVGASMAFDAARNTIVMFGGNNSGTGIGAYSSETWEYDGQRWTFRTLEGPPRTAGALMAYDPARQRTVLTGGAAVQISGQPAPDQRQTWEWDGNTWTMRAIAPVLMQGAIEYMPGLGIVVIRPNSVSSNSQVYTWDGTAWTLAPQTLPLFAGAISSAYDPNRAAMTIAASNGTFAWDGSTCTQIAAATNPYQRSLRYMPARNAVVGFVFSGPVIHELRPTGWTAISGQTGMNLTDPVASAALPDGRLLLFGGAATNNARVNCWRSDGATVTPLERRGPIGVEGPAMAFDPDRHLCVAFGGRIFNPAQFLETATWELRGETWKLRSNTGPPGRFDGSMTFNPASRLCVLHGGTTPAGQSTWTWNGQEWTDLGGTGPTGDGTMSWDSATSQLVYHDLESRPWTWNGSTWTPHTPYSATTGGNAGIAYDAARTQFIAVALNGGGTHRWTGSSWLRFINATQTSHYQPNITYSARLGGIILFGGFQGINNDGPYPNRTYFLSSTATSWTDLNTRGPFGRKYSGFVDDTTAERIVMYAGLANVHVPRDTWKFASGPAAVAIQPQPTSAPQGSAAELFIIAKGGGVISYQWRRHGQPLTDDARISGSNTDTLIISSLANTDAGEYDVIVTNPCGTNTSAAVPLSVTCQNDFNGDGDIGTDQDIEAFFACLGGTCCPTCGSADFNGDGDTGTDQDIESFFRVLGGSNC